MTSCNRWKMSTSPYSLLCLSTATMEFEVNDW